MSHASSCDGELAFAAGPTNTGPMAKMFRATEQCRSDTASPRPARWGGALVLVLVFAGGTRLSGSPNATNTLAKPGLHPELTEPPCSYCSTENRKGFIRTDDRVIAWIRGAHNGGAIPLRHFLSRTRIINDTYGLFFHDPDGGYVSAFKKDSGYTFYGWRNGIMVARGPDGTLWSCLSGRGLAGPKESQRLERLPAFMTEWSYWLMLHPESTAYNLFDGRKYEASTWPETLSEGAQATMGMADKRLEPLAQVLGVEHAGQAKVFPLDRIPERACFLEQIGGEPVAVFWYGPTRSAVSFSARFKERTLTFYADADSPETAPFKDRQTGTRWTLAGRSVDGPLRGEELTWIPGIQCRWYAWAAEFPQTTLHEGKPITAK